MDRHLKKKMYKGFWRIMVDKRKTTINKKMILISLLILFLIIYCVCKVVALIQNPTDTFTVEQGKIYQEEAATRIHY